MIMISVTQTGGDSGIDPSIGEQEQESPPDCPSLLNLSDHCVTVQRLRIQLFLVRRRNERRIMSVTRRSRELICVDVTLEGENPSTEKVTEFILAFASFIAIIFLSVKTAAEDRNES